MTTPEQPTKPYFPCPSGVKVTDHVTLKLRPTNYLSWKELMLSFLKSQELQGFVDGTISPMNKPPSLLREPSFFEEKRSAEEELKRRQVWGQQWRDSKQMSEQVHECLEKWKQEQKHVEEWEHERVKKWKAEQEHRREAKWRWEQKQWLELVWKHQKKRKQVWEERQDEESWQEFNQERKQDWQRQRTWEQEQESELTQKHDRLEKGECHEEIWQKLERETKSRNEWNRKREHQEKGKWERWEEWERGEKLQLEIWEEDRQRMDWKRSDGLVREWILAVVTEEILPRVIHLKTAQDMWNKLEKTFTTPFNQPSAHELIDWTDQGTGEVLSQYVVLHKAALKGEWRDAKDFLKKYPDAVFRPITWSLETALIVAARLDQRNNFIKKLLIRMVWESKKRERTEWIETIREMEREMTKMIQHKMERSEPQMMESLKKREQERDGEITSDWETMEKIEQEGMEKMEGMEQRGMEMMKWLREERRVREISMQMVDTMTENMMDRINERMKGMKEIDQEEMRNKWQMMEGMARDTLQWMRHSVMLLLETDISGATALHSAVKGGNMEVVKWLVWVNPLLANIVDMYGTLPVHLAARLGKREMVELLLRCNTRISDYKSGHKLWHSMVSGGLYDMALTLLVDHPKLASVEPSPLMELIAQNNILFPSGTPLNSLQQLIYSGIPLKPEDTANDPQQRELEDTADRPQEGDIENQNPAKCTCVVPPLIYVRQKLNALVRDVAKILGRYSQKSNALFWDVAEKLVPRIKSIRDIKLIHHRASMLVKCLCERVVETDFSNAAKIFKEPLFVATRMGIHEIVKEILESFPGAIHLTSDKNRSLFHIAIKYRQKNVYHLISQMAKDERAILLSMPDVSGNNALHLAGNLGPKQQLSLRGSVASAVLQMQKELYWFKEVGKAILPQAKERRNVHGRTPQDLFTETHKELVMEEEKWMKDTASSCSIVAILITTVAFTAALTVPGGSDGQTGVPLKLRHQSFTVFGISNATALIGSSASLLMFLSIQMGRYRELDFLDKIPLGMVIGLVTLFSSVICMIVAFFAAFLTVFGENKQAIIYPVGVISLLPGALLVWSMYRICRLIFDAIKSTRNTSKIF